MEVSGWWLWSSVLGKSLYLDIQRYREKIEIWVRGQWECIQNHCNYNKIAFILGVQSAKGHPEHLPSVEAAAEPLFVSQMVRKVTVASCNLGVREQCFSQKVAASVKA